MIKTQMRTNKTPDENVQLPFAAHERMINFSRSKFSEEDGKILKN